jgi:peptidoglycan/xylan/chitin deacetylase (PgdA/CDA1 family)
MNVPCPVHESRRAHKGCRFCRKPICRLCELKMRGHLYCSPRCARDDGRHDLWRRLSRVLALPVPPRLALSLLLLGASAPLLMAMRAARELERLTESPSRLSARRPAAGATIESVSYEPGGATVLGTATGGSAVFLFAGGRFAAAAPVVSGRFSFEGIRLPGPYRVGAMPLSAEASDAGAFQPAPLSAAPAASARLFVPDFTRGPADRPQILVSFDAGSTDRGALQILDALARRRIRTTIFVTGDFLRRYPDLARRIAADGHEAGNHTDTHPHLTSYAGDGRQATRPGVTRAFLQEELEQTARRWREVTGTPMAPIWRAPFGEHNAEIRRWALEAGYWHVGWTGGRAGLDGLDWISDPTNRSYRTAGRVVDLLVSRATNGGIILLHLGSEREDPVATRVPEMLDRLTARGFRFARAGDFLASAGMTEQRRAALTSPAPAP